MNMDESNPHAVPTKKRRTAMATVIAYFKYIYSFALLIFSVVIVMAAIFQQQTTATATVGFLPVAACLLFWFLIIWLAMMEGGQGALVGLQMIDKSVRLYLILLSGR